MKRAWREIAIALTPEEEPIWEASVSELWLRTPTQSEYYECPISPPVKGKATLPFDADLILELISHLQQPGAADEAVRKKVGRKLFHAYSQEKIV